tara:strand:+ start:590 stop:2356 length:1767 start_codon:yes stop_codon:yes gene_type:complete
LLQYKYYEVTLNFFYELINYILFFKNPLKLLVKFKKNNNNYLQLKKLIEEVKDIKPKYHQFNDEKYKFNNIKLKIYKKVTYFNSSNIWTNDNKDKEIYFYKVRFNWLLFDNEHLDINLKLKLINHFIIYTQNIVFDSYSISERISNIIIFINSAKCNFKSKELINIKKFLQNEIIKLTNNLEFYENKTNNHIISNNKAIFLYALYLNEKKYNKLCKFFFEFICQHNFYSSGFLNEGSSQYHLLITKHIIEILYFNKIHKNNILDEKIINFFYKVINKSYIFTCSKHLPNLGDCTPDLPIQYLSYMPYIASKLFDVKFPLEFDENKFFSNTYSNFFNLKYLKKPKPINKNHFFYDKISGYLLIVNNKVMILMQLYNSNVINARTHQHTEFGNFILYYDKIPIILDMGRINYQNSSLSSIGAEYHNSIKINNLQPLLCHKLNAVPKLMNNEYFQELPKFLINKKNSDYHLETIFYGYKRYRFKSVIKRNIIISKNFVKITDNINSNSKINYTSFFHFNDYSLKLIDKNVIDNKKLENTMYSFEILTDNCNTKFDKTFCSSQYLHKNNCISLKLNKKFNKIDNIEYIIKFK